MRLTEYELPDGRSFPIHPQGYFGDPRTDEFGRPTIHTGLDLPMPIGTRLLAFDDGVVVIAGFTTDPLGGMYLKIRRVDGTRYLFAHLSRVFVRVGEHVASGQVVALSGDTGSASTGPHLHWEERAANDIPRDPLTWRPKPVADYITRQEFDDWVRGTVGRDDDPAAGIKGVLANHSARIVRLESRKSSMKIAALLRDLAAKVEEL